VQGSRFLDWILNGVEGLEGIYVAPDMDTSELATQLFASQRGF